MEWLLSLFPAYQILRLKLETESAARIAAEDRERLWRARAESAEVDKAKAQADKDRSAQLVADWQCLVNGMPPIYGVAPVRRIEEDEFVPDEPRKRKITDIRAELESEFRKEMRGQAEKEYDAAYRALVQP